MRYAPVSVTLLAALSVACAAGPPVPQAAALRLESASVPASPEGSGYALLGLATSCWLGGLWNDALVETGAPHDAIEDRCDALLRAAGQPVIGEYGPLRAVDASIVPAIVEAVRVRAAAEQGQARAAALAELTARVADTAREDVHARRAADRVKQVFETYTPSERRENKTLAAVDLRESRALGALLRTKGPDAPAARTIGLLFALDRMEIARGLPKHLKLDAIGGPLHEVFGVRPPPVSSDPLEAIPKGAWVDYLERVASAGLRAIPRDAKDPQNREALAWNGVLDALADRLRPASDDPVLGAVVRGVVARLDRQRAGELAAFEAHAAPDR
jgi:hypothetical protein